ncbi:hypothetical protein ACH50O_03495 [Methylomonas sp. 2BW1-5-20]|uniref:hypothetical protein n=1 Tax=Methylomonas sp. 2BW1-5-20 TaxID=3376686 RepID=UPI00404F8354
MKINQKLTLIASLMAVSGIAAADLTNGPDPYATGYGFDTPTEAAWGGWNRGDAGTLYAEWDSFVDSSYPGTRTAAPDIGSAGTSNAYLGWNAGTFVSRLGQFVQFQRRGKVCRHDSRQRGRRPVACRTAIRDLGHACRLFKHPVKRCGADIHGANL